MAHFALVDAARSPEILALVQSEATRPGADVRCLFSGALSEDLAGASPWLVRYDPAAPFGLTFATRGWANDWGILFSSDAPPEQLRRSLRRHLQARLPDGRVVLFRFYDPRVFGPYLEALEGEELGPWFALVQGYWLPSAEGMVHYAQSPGGGLARQIVMPAPA